LALENRGNNNAETVAGAWEAEGSDFQAAVIREAVVVIPAGAAATQAVAVIRAAEDIRLMAAKGDIPTTILAVAVRVR
jgi:hypothetical protein